MKNNNKGLIFLHLPKNAGTTLNGILEKKYSKKEIFHVRYNENGIWNLNEFKELPQEEKDNIQLLTGHFNFGLHEYFSNDFNYITMLRHPVERTVSFYNFIKKQKTHRLFDSVKNKSIIECVTQVKDFDVVNGQARKLSNTDDENLMLNKALENIEQHFVFVGIQEYFDESILLLNNKLKLGIRYYSKLNVTRVKPQIDTELIREIEKTNQVDLELYNIIKNRFFEELEGINDKSAKIRLLRATNKSAKIRLLRATDKLKAIYDKVKIVNIL